MSSTLTNSAAAAREKHQPTLERAMAGRATALEQALQTKKELGRYVIAGCGGSIALFMNTLKDTSGLSAATLTLGIVLMAAGLFFGVRAIHYLSETYQDFADDWVDYENEAFALMLEAAQGNQSALNSKGLTTPEMEPGQYQGDLYRSYWMLVAGGLAGLLYLLHIGDWPWSDWFSAIISCFDADQSVTPGPTNPA